MTHIWTVRQKGRELGTVEAVSRKGACHAAYEKFGVEQSKRSTISVELLLHRDIIQQFSPTSTHRFGDVACSFNPTLAGEAQEKTLKSCRERFETGPFQGFPRKPE